MLRLWQRYRRRFGAWAAVIVTATIIATAVNYYTGALKIRDIACGLMPSLGQYTSCPAAPEFRPQLAAYQERLNDFRVALKDGDEAFLQRLSGTDFLIQEKDICLAAGWFGERTGPQVLSEAGTGIFLRSIPENHACDSGSWMLRRKSVSIPVVLLDQALFPHAVGEESKAHQAECGVDLAVKYWPRQSEIIQRVVQKPGTPADFSQALAGYRGLFEKLKAMPAKTYESACLQALLTEHPSPEFIFSSASCRGMEFLQRRWRLQKAYGSSDEEAAAHVCKGAGALDLAAYEEALKRWTPSVRAEGG